MSKYRAQGRYRSCKIARNLSFQSYITWKTVKSVAAQRFFRSTKAKNPPNRAVSGRRFRNPRDGL